MARSVVDDMESLGHWARVAFAARCARNVLPLFQRYWPNATAERQESLQAAVRLAEQSAANGRTADGTNEAMIGAVAAAGAALMPVYGVASGEPVPADENACYIASFVAKVAEWAAKAAQGDASASANAALEALTFCRDAAHAAEAVEVLEQLQSDFAGLYRVATQGRWSDKTPVPPSVFGLLSDELSRKAWWRFW
jgi:hypothetical protein